MQSTKCQNHVLGTIDVFNFRLRKDRERQEQLARERLEARRNAKRKKAKMEEEPEPEKGSLDRFQYHIYLLSEANRRSSLTI